MRKVRCVKGYRCAGGVRSVRSVRPVRGVRCFKVSIPVNVSDLFLLSKEYTAHSFRPSFYDPSGKLFRFLKKIFSRRRFSYLMNFGWQMMASPET